MPDKEVKATTKFVRVSPRKVRLVVDLVRGKTVEEALDLLEFVPRRGAQLVRKTVESAAANARQTYLNADPSELRIQKAWADEGPRLRRVHPRGRFRRDVYARPTSHITVVLLIPSRLAS